MKRYRVAALLVGVSAVPASAATFYVMFDRRQEVLSRDYAADRD